MSNRLTLGAYWKPRRESIEQCADRLLAFMHGLAQCDIAFSQWYKLGRSRKDALKHVIDIRNRDELLKLLNKGRHRNFYKQVMEDLGFIVGIWNGGKEGKDVSLRVCCGSYWVSPNPNVAGIGNSVTLDFPEQFGELADVAKASRILALTASCWEPDRGEIVSRELKDVGDLQEWRYANWMVYVPRKIASVPPPSTVTHLENGGSLIVVQPNPPAVDNPEDQERIRRVRRVLGTDTVIGDARLPCERSE